jgi:outer membrane protein
MNKMLLTLLVVSAATACAQQPATPVSPPAGTVPSGATPLTFPTNNAPAQTTLPSNTVAAPQPQTTLPSLSPLTRPTPITLPAFTPQTLSGPVQPITLGQAEQRALAANPQISAARLLAFAEGQVVRETRAADLPNIGYNLTAVTANTGGRITAGALNNPSVYQRVGTGISATQLLTDFGRTRDLIRASHLRAQAAEETQLATSNDIIFAVDEAFYKVLAAQSILNVAHQTQATRRQAADQIRALTNAKLKSTLDLSFANVDVSQAKLLVLDSRNSMQAAMAVLNALLGNENLVNYQLVDPAPTSPPVPPADAYPLVQLALQQRPDLLYAVRQQGAAQQFSNAEHKLRLPTISALGAAGVTPARADQITSSWYGAVGANVNIPLFTGFSDEARAKEAAYRAQAAGKQVTLLRNQVARDVRETVLEAQNNFERIAVTQQIFDQADTSLKLLQTRYRLGLSSIVELSQAQLTQTQAEIDFQKALYAYQTSLAAIRYQTGQ